MSNSINSKDYQEYKYDICSGRNCSNKPASMLKVLYINKKGFFCETCKDFLLKKELAIPFEEVTN